MAKQVSYIIAIFINDNLGKKIKVYKNFAEIAQLWYNNSRYFEKKFGVPASVTFGIFYSDGLLDVFSVKKEDSRLADKSYGNGMLVDLYRRDIYGVNGDKEQQGLVNLSNTDKDNLFLAVCGYYIAIIKEAVSENLKSTIYNIESYYNTENVLPLKYKHQFHCFKRAMNEECNDIVKTMMEEIKDNIDHKNDENKENGTT